MSEIDKVIAVLESNNNNIEEALLFVFIREQYTFILWENINTKRAAYVFRVKKQFSEEALGGIKNIAQKNIKYKRETLFRKNKFKFKINHEDYTAIIHENLSNYIRKLDHYISYPCQ